MTPPSPVRVFDMLRGFQKTEALKSGLELGLFTAIAKGQTTASAIAAACGNISERGVRILSDYLTIEGMLTKSPQGEYGLSEDAKFFLVEGSPAYLGGAVSFLCHESQREGFTKLTDAVRKGGTALSGLGSMDDSHPAWVEFAKGMMPMMMPAAQMIAGLLGGSANKVLDIAAGHGLFGIVVAQHNPNAQIFALDWANVLEVASQHARDFGAGDRHHTIAGDAFLVDYGATDYDAVLLTNFLHHFDYATNVTLLKRVHAALKPGGKAVILEFVPNDDRVTPVDSAGFALTMLAETPHGDAFTFRELDSMCRDAGFAAASMHPVGVTPQTIVMAQRPA